MRRRWGLWVFVGVVIATAVGLRVRSHYLNPRVSLQDESLCQFNAPPDLPVPHDYVLHPQVDPSEAEAGPKRIISLAPSISEVLCALGMKERLIGRTPYCKYPPVLESVPPVGALTDTNFEKIRSLSPEIVLLTSNSGQVAAGLEQLGIAYQEVPHDTLPQVYEAIELVGRICHRPRTAASLVSALRADLDRLAVYSQQAGGRSWRVMMVLGDLGVPPTAQFVAGPSSFLDGLLKLAGQTNAVTEADADGYVELPLERIVMLDPEVILEFRESVTAAAMLDVYRGWAGVGTLQAISRQRVRSVGGREFLSAGPRVNLFFYRLLSTLQAL